MTLWLTSINYLHILMAWQLFYLLQLHFQLLFVLLIFILERMKLLLYSITTLKLVVSSQNQTYQNNLNCALTNCISTWPDLSLKFRVLLYDQLFVTHVENGAQFLSGTRAAVFPVIITLPLLERKHHLNHKDYI